MSEEHGWVIERHYHSCLHYWTGRAKGQLGEWSSIHADALRLAREDDANAMLSWHCDGIGRVVRHLWSDAERAHPLQDVPVSGPARHGEEHDPATSDADLFHLRAQIQQVIDIFRRQAAALEFGAEDVLTGVHATIADAKAQGFRECADALSTLLASQERA